MRRQSALTTLALAAAAAGLAACGDNRPNSPAEMSPAVSTPAPGVPQQVAPQAASDAAAQPDPTGPTTPAAGEQGGTDQCRAVAKRDDAASLGRLDDAWRMARAEADAKGFAAKVEKLGVLVDPNAAQAGRLQPPPGAYRCRTIKMGSRDGAGLAYVDDPWFACSVELTPGGDLILEKITGSQRVKGLLYPDTERRLVYVGTQAWGDERGFPAYGAQPDRDQAGVFERIGPERWRLVIPFPKQESQLDIIEVAR